MELIFSYLYIKAVFLEPLQHVNKVGDVFILGSGEDENIVQENEHKMVEEVPDHVVHQSLEYSRGISAPEES